MEYKRCKLPGRYNLTLMGHTDGLSISESSNVSLWPLEWVKVEIPPHLRFKFLTVGGVWVDDSHPYMNCFLKPFADELRQIYETGIKWTHPKTKEEHISYVVAPLFCADAPARAQIQNISSHGGRYCCHLCEQKMVMLPAEPVVLGEKTRKRKRVFLYQEEPSKLRTAHRMESQGKMARNNERLTGKLVPVKGVRGQSVVSNLPKCNRSSCVYPEYMHILLGIFRVFMEL